MNGSAPSNVTVAVLAGGLGTRLRSALGNRPKVLAEVNGHPFLRYLLDQLADAGFQRAVLCTGYRAEEVRGQFGPRYRTLRLEYSPEPESLGTGGALRHATPLFGPSHVLVLNGDSYVDADLRNFCQRHGQAQSRASLLLVEMPDVGRYGQVEITADGHIQSFREKQGTVGAGLINAGVYLLERALLQGIKPGGAVSLERECFPNWLNLPLHGMVTRSRFIDIGTPESYREAEAFFQVRKASARPIAAAAFESLANYSSAPA